VCVDNRRRHSQFLEFRSKLHYISTTADQELAHEAAKSEGDESVPRNLTRSAQSWEICWSFWSAKFRGIETLLFYA